MWNAGVGCISYADSTACLQWNQGTAGEVLLLLVLSGASFGAVPDLYGTGTGDISTFLRMYRGSE